MADALSCHTYDGDTPQDARRAIRERANLILTNPDMLHTGVLPHHTKWAKCFENLRFIVIDELHYYRGVYGSHLANLLRRLRRICEFYGSKPQFICSSATIGNPKDLAEAITECPFQLIDKNGAPAGERYFVFYNPPVVNRQLGIRRSYLTESRRVALEFIRQRQQTLVFANNRLATEILVTYLKDACAHLPFSNEAIRGYRGGYLPKERREIEHKLRDGEIRAVVATNALELGVDIGSLDAVVLAGYPGNDCLHLAACRPRGTAAGFVRSRAGRLKCAAGSIHRRASRIFLRRDARARYINADNLEILLNHLKCAAFELPIQDGEKFGLTTPKVVRVLFAKTCGCCITPATAWHWVSDSYPADTVSLRAVTSDNFLVVDITGDHKIIGEVDFPSALTTLHEKAIYLHDSRQYPGGEAGLRWPEGIRPARRLRLFHRRDRLHAGERTRRHLIQQRLSRTSPRGKHGEVRVKRQIVGFKKIKFYTLENIGAGQLSLPEQEMHTTAFWLHFPG